MSFFDDLNAGIVMLLLTDREPSWSPLCWRL